MVLISDPAAPLILFVTEDDACIQISQSKVGVVFRRDVGQDIVPILCSIVVLCPVSHGQLLSSDCADCIQAFRGVRTPYM